MTPTHTAADPPAQSAAGADPPYPSPARAWFVVIVLTLGYVFSFLDRQILALLVDPIRRDLAISDTQMSLLMGLAFGLFYTSLGVPLGALADRANRRNIVAVGVTVWCLMTAACGLARTYAQLFVARIGVGIGEATLNPSALSMISDLFPRESRARALTFYNTGVSLGVGIANLLGGVLIAFVSGAALLSWPIVGDIKPWQAVFILVGLPGLIVALLLLLVREPLRRDRIARDRKVGFRETLRFLGERRMTYITHFLGLSVVTIIGYGFFAWIPTMFVRTWGWTIPQISFAYGLLNLIGGPVGVVAAGVLADRLYARGYRDGLMRICLIGAVIFAPASLLVALMPTAELAIVMLIPASICGALITATGSSALMMITPNEFRGQTSALYYLVISGLGLTIGPTAIALVTDYVFADDNAIRYSIAIVSGVSGIVALGFLVAHLPLYRAGVAAAEQWASR